MANCVLKIIDKNSEQQSVFNVNNVEEFEGKHIIPKHIYRKKIVDFLKSLKSNKQVIQEMFKNKKLTFLNISENDKKTIINNISSEFISDDIFNSDITMYIIEDEEVVSEFVNLYGKKILLLSTKAIKFINDKKLPSKYKYKVLNDLLNVVSDNDLELKISHLKPQHKAAFRSAILELELEDSIFYKNLLKDTSKIYDHVFNYKILNKLSYYNNEENIGLGYSVGDWIVLKNNIEGIFIGRYNNKDLVLYYDKLNKKYSLYYVDKDNIKHYKTKRISLDFKQNVKRFTKKELKDLKLIDSNYKRLLNTSDILQKEDIQYLILKIEYFENNYGYILQDENGNLHYKSINDLINESFYIQEYNRNHFKEININLDLKTTYYGLSFDPRLNEIINQLSNDDYVYMLQHKDSVEESLLQKSKTSVKENHVYVPYRISKIINNNILYYKVEKDGSVHEEKLDKYHDDFQIVTDKTLRLSKDIITLKSPLLRHYNNIKPDSIKGYRFVKFNEKEKETYYLKGNEFLYDLMDFIEFKDYNNLSIGDLISINHIVQDENGDEYIKKQFFKITNIVTKDNKKHYFYESIVDLTGVEKSIFAYFTEDKLKDSKFKFYTRNNYEPIIINNTQQKTSSEEVDQIIIDKIRNSLKLPVEVVHFPNDGSPLAYTDGYKIYINSAKKTDQYYFATQATHELIHIILGIMRFQDLELYNYLTQAFSGDVMQKEEQIVESILNIIGNNIKIDDILRNKNLIEIMNIIKSSFNNFFETTNFGEDLRDFHKTIQSNFEKFLQNLNVNSFKNLENIHESIKKINKQLNALNNIDIKCN